MPSFNWPEWTTVQSSRLLVRVEPLLSQLIVTRNDLGQCIGLRRHSRRTCRRSRKQMLSLYLVSLIAIQLRRVGWV